MNMTDEISKIFESRNFDGLERVNKYPSKYSNISDLNSPSLTIFNATQSDNGLYKCFVCIVENPLSDICVCAGEDTTVVSIEWLYRGCKYTSITSL